MAAEVQSGLGQPKTALDSHQLDLYEKVSDCATISQGINHPANEEMSVSICLSVLLCLHTIHYEDGCIAVPDAAGSTERARQAKFETNHCKGNNSLHPYVACDSSLMHIISVRCS